MSACPASLVAAALLVACSPSRQVPDLGRATADFGSSARADPPPVTARRPSSAPLAAPPSANEEAAGVAAPATPEAASRVLERAVDAFRSDPKGAAALLQALPGVGLAEAYLGVLALEAGDAAGAGEHLDRARAALSDEARAMVATDDGAPTTATALRLLRVAVEEYPDRAHPFLACSVFERHPAEATVAFGGMWGSTRDTLGSRLKDTCIDDLLKRAAPALLKPAGDALGELFQAMRTVAPPPDGTMFVSMFIADGDTLRDALLAPEVPYRFPLLSLPESLADAARVDPGLGVRARSFPAIRARAVPAFGQAICALLAARGRPADPAACRARAESAATQALASWVEARASATR